MRREYLELYRKSGAAQDGGKRDSCRPPPRQILLDYSTQVTSFNRIVNLHSLKGGGEGSGRVQMGCDPPRSFFGNLGFFKEELQNLLDIGYSVFVFAEYAHQAQRLGHLFKDLEVTVLPQGISQGFSLPALQILVIEENEIFGRKRRIPRSVATAKSRAIDSFVDLSPGDYVVHLQYGIGLFNGKIGGAHV